MSCDRAILFEFVSGELPSVQAGQLHAHLQSCAACRADLVAARSLMAGLTSLRAPERMDDAHRAAIWQDLEPVAVSSERNARRSHSFSRWWSAGGRQQLALAAGIALVVSAGAFALGHAHAKSGEAAVAQAVRSDYSEPREIAVQPVAQKLAWAEQKPAPAGDEHVDATAPEADAAAEPPLVREAAPAPTVADRVAPARRHLSQDKELHLACGAVLGGDTSHTTLVRNQAQAAEVRLNGGEIHVRVPHLEAGATLIVRTEDATVSVVGTEFSVVKRDPTATRVEVQQGTVWVQPRGRGREQVTLHAGESLDIQSESAWHAELVRAIDLAIAQGQLQTAVNKAFRALDVLPDDESAPVRMRLAGVYRSQNAPAAAAEQYRLIVEGAGPLSARDNAAAALGWLARGHADKEREQWQRYVDQFADGIHRRDALLRLVDLTCTENSAQAQRVRKALAADFPADAAAAEALSRCGKP